MRPGGRSITMKTILHIRLVPMLAVFWLAACTPSEIAHSGEQHRAGEPEPITKGGQMMGSQDGTTTGTATFAGGCFWCMEPSFEQLEGVEAAVSGYTGGEGADPTYEDYERKGYLEAVQIRFDPSAVDYEQLLDVYWRQIDPTDAGGQFADRGPGYRPAIFYHDERQKELAEASRRRLAESGRFDGPIVVDIVPAGRFYPAEDGHQDYYRKNPLRYKTYKRGSGRAGFLEKHWDK